MLTYNFNILEWIFTLKLQYKTCSFGHNTWIVSVRTAILYFGLN